MVLTARMWCARMGSIPVIGEIMFGRGIGSKKPVLFLRGSAWHGLDWKELKNDTGYERFPVGVLAEEDQQIAARLELKRVGWFIDVPQFMTPLVDVVRRAVDLDLG